MRVLTLGLLAVLVAVSPAVVRAQPPNPTAEIKQQVNQILGMLRDAKFRAEPAGERHSALRAVADQVFDWTEMSKRALGPHWRERTPAEREEFVRLFADVLEQAYVDKIEGYQGERVLYQGEAVEGDHAVVRTVIQTPKGQSVPLDYHLLLEGGRWKIYDVDVTGVSLVGNYRSQFNDVIRRASYGELVRRLRSRAGETGRASPPSAR